MMMKMKLANHVKKLQDEYGDEYALYACEDLLGLTWIDRQIIFINVSAIERVNNEIPYNDETDLLIEFYQQSS